MSENKLLTWKPRAISRTKTMSQLEEDMTFYKEQDLLKAIKTKTNLLMTWTVYEKSIWHDSVKWIIECLKMFKISKQIVNFNMRAMEN